MSSDSTTPGAPPERAASARPERAERVLALLGFALVLLAIGIALEPIFRDLSALGGHDWDEHSAHRYLTVKALEEFHQLPLWMPYACGGFSEWANVQGAPNLVSPFLPFYLLFDLRYALRIEIVGVVLLSAFGTWLWAGRFTRSAAARCFACVVWVANGRFALQAATGHTWHLYYALTPWVFYAFERATRCEHGPLELGDVVLGGGALAFMVYAGAIYPLPQTLLLLGVYALARALFESSARPVAVCAAFGVTAFGLSALKLVPLLIDFGARPRPIASNEFIDLNAFVELLVAPHQTPGSRPAPVPQWGWHEYGMYIGWLPFLVLIAGTLSASGRRERAARWAGVAALLLGFGHFNEHAPWTLLHQVSLFRSQHVPTRWLYPALLILAVITAGGIGRLRPALGRARLVFEVLGLLALAPIAVDIGLEANLPLQAAFWMRPPPVRPAGEFHQEQRVPRFLQYERRDYAPEALPAMRAGIGVIECTMHSSLNIWAPKDERGLVPGLGARGRGSRAYRGEAYTESGVGQARITFFSPNRVEVEVHGARPGDLLILNQNHDPGWSVNRVPAHNHEDALAAPIRSPDQRFVFQFRPPGLWGGALVFAATLVVLSALVWRKRQRRPGGARAGEPEAPVADPSAAS